MLNRFDDYLESNLPAGLYPLVGAAPDEDLYDRDTDPQTALPTGDDCTNPWDRDRDGLINALDLDDDGDDLWTSNEGIDDIDCLEGSVVPIGDRIPNYLD